MLEGLPMLKKVKTLFSFSQADGFEAELRKGRREKG